MTIGSLPLGYCTNVHPAQSVGGVLRGLDDFTLPVRDQIQRDAAAGLWLAAPVVAEIQNSPGGPSSLRAELDRRGLCCYTLNAFPYGDFHSDRVKEQVYLPHWADPRRLDYTQRCAEILAALLPAGVDGSISTSPLAFRGAPGTIFVPVDGGDAAGRPARTTAPGATTPDEAAMIAQLGSLARFLSRLRQQIGRCVRLAIEPEPCCLLETTPQTISFFERLRTRAADEGWLDAAVEHLGVCFDVCHQAVEFEDVAESMAALHHSGVRINKVHVTCALQWNDPAANLAGREALVRFAEPRYLHQTFARTPEGVGRIVDLTPEAVAAPDSAGFCDLAGRAVSAERADCWRIHFHVPVDAESIGPLTTTRPELLSALRAAARLPYAPHLEVETYTWHVLPGAEGRRGPPDLVDGLVRELQATHAFLDELRREEPHAG